MHHDNLIFDGLDPDVEVPNTRLHLLVEGQHLALTNTPEISEGASVGGRVVGPWDGERGYQGTVVDVFHPGLSFGHTPGQLGFDGACEE